MEKYLVTKNKTWNEQPSQSLLGRALKHHMALWEEQVKPRGRS